jgi:hypothetical protein
MYPPHGGAVRRRRYGMPGAIEIEVSLADGAIGVIRLGDYPVTGEIGGRTNTGQ